MGEAWQSLPDVWMEWTELRKEDLKIQWQHSVGQNQKLIIE